MKCYILADIEGTVEDVTKVYIGEFNDDSINAFDVDRSLEAAKEKIKQVDNNDIYTVTQIDEPVLCRYRGKNALKVNFKYDNTTDSDYISHEEGMVIIVPKE